MSIWDTWGADPRYAQVVNDPRFLQATPLFRSKIHDILFKYGFTPTADQQGLAGGPVENNPYSVSNMLKQGHTSADHSTINAANAAGLEESGAAAGALNANNEAYKKGVSQAAAQMGGEVGGALTDYTGSINSIFGDLENNTVPTLPSAQGQTPDSPIPQTHAAIGTNTPLTTHDEGPGAYAQMHATGIPSVAQKLKAKRINPIGGMGRIT